MSFNKKPNALGNNPYFDLKMGIVVALVMGGLVFLVNIKYGAGIAFVASLKQAAYTFLFGGIFIRLSENLATHFENDRQAIILAVFIAGSSTILATYLVHSLKGTPEPLESTIPTLLGAPPSYCVWAIRKRKQMKKMKKK